jgi:molybdopterin-containing oxidoreductase family iron-sulfur binding subunit
MNESGRRGFLRKAGAVAALAMTGCRKEAIEAFVRTHLRAMDREELKRFLEGLESKYESKFGKEVTVRSTPATPGVKFGYALDLSRCVGCRRCVYACVEENNQSRPADDGQKGNPIHWITVLEMEKEKGIDFAHANAYYDDSKVPQPGHFYVPVQCQQCENPPCVRACPVKATWTEPDGIVVIDYDWCIGCRCCMSACPYGARRFNWREPNLPSGELNPETHVLGNRPRPRGVVEKCTFCIQRVRQGRYPACVEVCPVGARKFGNLLDPESEIRYLLEHERVYILKEELNTQPKFFYFFS